MTLRILAVVLGVIALAVWAAAGLEAFLFVVQIELLAFLYPTAWILTRAAAHKPYELALVLMAIGVDAIVLVVSVFIVAAINTGLGNVIPIDLIRSAIRGSFIPLEIFGLLFFVAYRRRWFRSGAGTTTGGTEA